jgi:hypothetical protein
LNNNFPKLAQKAWLYKKKTGLSTVEVWKHIVGLGDNYVELLLDTEKTIKVVNEILNA